jgi:hypothetical protein
LDVLTLEEFQSMTEHVNATFFLVVPISRGDRVEFLLCCRKSSLWGPSENESI